MCGRRSFCLSLLTEEDFREQGAQVCRCLPRIKVHSYVESIAVGIRVGTVIQ